MSLSRDLLLWYDAHRRTLPWRGESDPYRVWLSEIMLQQTQTETVKGYYARFLERFPTVSDLASAEESQVLKLWEGLGYYSRARNLHAAAKRVAGEMGGIFPDTAEGLRKLPGVGPYAANAIASIAYGEPVPALDGNQARVLCRVLAWEPELKTPFDIVGPAAGLMDTDRPGDYNQALMDLGASICTPRQPKCGDCPLASRCNAQKLGNPEEYPHKPAPVEKKHQDWTILLVRVNDRLLVLQRPKGLLGGLYEYCSLEGHWEPDALIEKLREKGFHGISGLQRLPDSRHVFTHLVWHMQGYRLDCETAPETYHRADLKTLKSLPFPTALRAYRSASEDLAK